MQIFTALSAPSQRAFIAALRPSTANASTLKQFTPAQKLLALTRRAWGL